MMQYYKGVKTYSNKIINYIVIPATLGNRLPKNFLRVEGKIASKSQIREQYNGSGVK